MVKIMRKANDTPNFKSRHDMLEDTELNAVVGGRVIRITNIRANANALGVAGANAIPTEIAACLN